MGTSVCRCRPTLAESPLSGKLDIQMLVGDLIIIAEVGSDVLPYGGTYLTFE